MYALLSVYDKSGIVDLAKAIQSKFQLVSTGGTYRVLMEAGLNVTPIETFTGFPEILNGRVKTLHPKVHGAILRTDKEEHKHDMEENEIQEIGLVVCNLYPFAETVQRTNDESEIIENIDIGGPTMLRSAAKNFRHVTVLCDPEDYQSYASMLENDSVDLDYRKEKAIKAFEHVVSYDANIVNYFSSNKVVKVYEKKMDLKYGCNPHQDAALYRNVDSPDYLKVLNGNLGYINVLDALNSWELVYELAKESSLVSCASFKHVSPAGVGTSVPLSDELKKAYFQDDNLLGALSPQTVAYIRARGADPKSSFGDFIALSHRVDVVTAMLIKKEVSDGIIAPGYDSGALSVLQSKKKGKYVILEIDVEKYANGREGNSIRDVANYGLMQQKNTLRLGYKQFEKCCTQKRMMPPEARLDLLIATITAKYTQSNSVVLAYQGQAIGIGAGQQSRVDCVKLACEKAKTWFLRQHPKVLELISDYDFKKMKRQIKVNAVIDYIENNELEVEMSGLALSSDAFFPFRDSIDIANEYGVSYVLQPGGSTRDRDVIQACDEYGMCMAFTGIRVFHH